MHFPLDSAISVSQTTCCPHIPHQCSDQGAGGIFFCSRQHHLYQFLRKGRHDKSSNASWFTFTSLALQHSYQFNPGSWVRSPKVPQQVICSKGTAHPHNQSPIQGTFSKASVRYVCKLRPASLQDKSLVTHISLHPHLHDLGLSRITSKLS